MATKDDVMDAYESHKTAISLANKAYEEKICDLMHEFVIESFKDVLEKYPMISGVFWGQFEGWDDSSEFCLDFDVASGIKINKKYLRDKIDAIDIAIAEKQKEIDEFVAADSYSKTQLAESELKFLQDKKQSLAYYSSKTKPNSISGDYLMSLADLENDEGDVFDEETSKGIYEAVIAVFEEFKTLEEDVFEDAFGRCKEVMVKRKTIGTGYKVRY